MAKARNRLISVGIALLLLIAAVFAAKITAAALLLIALMSGPYTAIPVMSAAFAARTKARLCAARLTARYTATAAPSAAFAAKLTAEQFKTASIHATLQAAA